MFAFYRALVGLRLAPERPELRAGSIDVFHVNDGGRTLAFLRTLNGSSSLVVATLSNAGFDHYDLRYPSLAGRGWREVFNSDSETFGGWGATNGGSSLVPQGDVLSVRLPRAGFVLFETS